MFVIEYYYSYAVRERFAHHVHNKCFSPCPKSGFWRRWWPKGAALLCSSTNRMDATVRSGTYVWHICFIYDRTKMWFNGKKMLITDESMICHKTCLFYITTSLCIFPRHHSEQHRYLHVGKPFIFVEIYLHTYFLTICRYVSTSIHVEWIFWARVIS